MNEALNTIASVIFEIDFFEEPVLQNLVSYQVCNPSKKFYFHYLQLRCTSLPVSLRTL